jgi:hypothetical protein
MWRDQSVLPVIRATTHVEGQGDQVVAPGSTRRRLLVEDDHGASRGRRCRAARLRGGRRGRPVVLSQGARAMGVPVGEGSARRRLGRSREVDPGPVCARFRPRLRSSAHARTARSPVAHPRSRWALHGDLRSCVFEADVTMVVLSEHPARRRARRDDLVALLIEYPEPDARAVRAMRAFCAAAVSPPSHASGGRLVDRTLGKRDVTGHTPTRR